MCGKFTTKLSWTELVDYVWGPQDDGEDGAVPVKNADRGNPQKANTDDDRVLTLRVTDAVPLIVLDIVAQKRRVVPMRWGFPHPKDWKRPQPIHARAETIDATPAFADAFREGQRGIALVQTFNEAPDIEGPTIQHTITPDAPVGIAFVWRRFQSADMPAPILAACMVTVAANDLIASLPTDRMPAVLDKEDWAIWLGDENATPERVKACLKTQQGVRWTMAKEERAAKKPRSKPTASDPTGTLLTA